MKMEYLFTCPHSIKTSQKIQLLLHTSDTIFAEPDFFCINYGTNGALVRIQTAFSALEFEKYYFTQCPFMEPIEDDIVASFSDEDHVLGCEWEVRQRGQDFLIDFAGDAVFRILHRALSVAPELSICDNSHYEKSDHEAKNNAKNERESVHNR